MVEIRGIIWKINIDKINETNAHNTEVNKPIEKEE